MNDPFDRQQHSADEQEQFSPEAESETQAQRKQGTAPPQAETELGASIARLSSPSDEQAEGEIDHDLQRRLHMVDHLLRSAPLVGPGVDLAERVISALRRQDGVKINRYTASGIIIGLGAAGVIATWLMVGLITTAVGVALNWTSVYQALLMLGGVANRAIRDLFTSMTNPDTSSPLMVGFSLLSIPLLIVWLRLMRRFASSEGEF